MMNKSLTSKLSGLALAGLGGLVSACSSVPSSLSGSFDESFKSDYSSNGFQISKNPTAFSTLTVNHGTSFGSVSVYGADISSRHNALVHEYDLGASASVILSQEEVVDEYGVILRDKGGVSLKETSDSLTVGTDRFMFPHDKSLDASNEGWFELSTRRVSPLDRLALRYTDARWGSGNGSTLRLSLDKGFEIGGRTIGFSGALVRNNGYFISRGDHDEFAELQVSVPLYGSSDGSFSASLTGRRIESFGSGPLVDANSLGISLTWNFGSGNK